MATHTARWIRWGATALLVATACGSTGDRSSVPAADPETARAILYVESDWPLGPFESLPPLKAVTPQGDAVQIPAASQGAWSPGGDTLAFLDPEARSLSIVESEGGERELFEAPSNGMLVFGPSWSPSGERLAAVMVRGSRFQLVVVEAAHGTSATHPLPRRIGENFTTPLFFQWAPDGREVLLAWGPVVSIDAVTGDVTIHSRRPAVAAWGPDGSVYLVTVTREGGAGLVRRTADGLATTVASRQELERAGLDRIFGLVATLSGERFIFMTAAESEPVMTLHAFDLRGERPLDVDAPSATAPIHARPVVFEASPDGSEVAFISTTDRKDDKDGGVTPVDVELRIIELASGETTSIARWDTWWESPWMATQPLDILRLVKSLSWGA